jgi:putative SOS response-associated peptidase YedK
VRTLHPSLHLGRDSETLPAHIAGIVQPSYNVCPTDTVNVVTSFQDTRILQPMRWGLIPRWWSKPLKDLMRLSTFNARVETVTTKPFFREAFKRTRCIIPASGYYEWQDTPAGKQPHFSDSARTISSP